jgi:hypothetical protein
MRRLWPLPFFLALTLFSARPAHAQHFDANFETGYSRRFLSGGTLTGSNGFPLIGVTAAIALAPLFRLGVYFDEELANDGEPKSPFITTLGARIKFLPPLGSKKWKMWLFLGFGYGAVVAPSYTQVVGATADNPNPNQTGTALKDGGSFLEVPFGIGASYKLRAPWVVLGELSGRAGLNSQGSYFDPTGRPTVTAQGDSLGLITGSESFAILATLGIGIDL